MIILYKHFPIVQPLCNLEHYHFVFHYFSAKLMGAHINKLASFNLQP